MAAGYGSGFVYLSKELLERSKPRAIGWLSVEDPYADRNNEIHLRQDAAARAERLQAMGVDEAVVFPNFGLLWERTLDADLGALAQHTLTAVQGGLLLTQIRRDPNQLRSALDGALAAILAARARP